MHKDSDLRDNDANSTRGEASLRAPKHPDRRQMLTATALSAGAMVTPSLLGRSRAAAQTAEEPDRAEQILEKVQKLQATLTRLEGSALYGP